MAFFLPYTLTVPHFLCTVEGFTLSVKDATSVWESKEEAMRIIRETLLENDTFTVLIGDVTSLYNLTPATTIISTIDVSYSKSKVLANPPRNPIMKKLLWDIYFQNYPPVSWPSYFMLLWSLRNIIFADMDYGCALLVAKECCLHCFKYKGADHEDFNCVYSTLEG